METEKRDDISNIRFDFLRASGHRFDLDVDDLIFGAETVKNCSDR